MIFSGTIIVLNYFNEKPLNNNNTPNHNVFDGYNIFVLEKNRQKDRVRNLTLLITDMEGKTIIKKDYLKEPRGLDVYPVELFNTTTVLLGDDDVVPVLWNFVTNVTFDLSFRRHHHDLEYNANNNTFITMDWYSTEINDIRYGFDWIKEYDWQGRLLWSLNTREFIYPSMWCPFQDSYGETRDLTHGNTVFYDVEEDIIYYLSRNCNTFYKIDHKTKAILWKLGEYGDFQLFDKRGNPRDHLFFHAHSVERINTDTFILFDNDKHNQTNPNNKRSRIVEITIDENTMTANESWSWTAPEEYYSDIWGDADRLPNGNRLGTFGTQTHPNTDIGPRLVEVNDSGDIVWELNYPTDEEYKYGIYSMERFRFTPSISSPPDVWTLTTGDVNVTWQTWYNFRTKQLTWGAYNVFLDNVLIDSNQHVFEKWWLPTNLTVTLNNLSPGEHNLTVVLADDGGSTTKDTVTIYVTAQFKIVQDDILLVYTRKENSKNHP